MKVRYENLSDTLIFQLRPGVPIADVREDLAGSLYCYGADGELVAMEIVDASLQPELIRSLEKQLDKVVDDGEWRHRPRKEFADGG